MTEGDPQLRASVLRAMGIDHVLLETDQELVEYVELLRDIGVSLDEMIDQDLTLLAAPLLIRPGADIDPREVFSRSLDDADFRAKAAVALGYRIDEDSRFVTQDEVETIEFFNQLRKIIGDDDLLVQMRVLGSSMGRTARSIITALRLHYETPIAQETGSLVEVSRAYRDATTEMLPGFLHAASTVLRRHIATAASTPTVWDVDGSQTGTLEQATVGFVDLVGFTSFTEKANLEQFVAALRTFESQAQAVIVNHGGTLIKLIGDEVMFVAPTPASGVEIANRLASLSLDESGPVSVRIGLSAGEVVAVGGDYYGTVVNIASRAVDEAEPDTIVVTAAVVEGSHASTAFESLGPRRLRGISDPVELFRLI